MKALINKKNLLPILAIFGVLFFTNLSFLAYCEKDLVLEFINRAGNWTNAILWQSSKIFLYYATADAFYNIRYVLPKLAYTLAPIKVADKVNGWLGGSSTGELERHLAQQTYHPLYKDALNGLYTNIGLPFYTNIWGPLVGIKPKKNVTSFSIREPIVLEYNKERKTLVTQTQYQTIDKHDEDIVRLTESLDKLTLAINQGTLVQLNKKTRNELLEELAAIKTLEDIPTFTSEDLKNNFLEYNFSHVRFNETTEFMPLRVEYIQFFKDSPGIKIKFDSSSNLKDYVIMSKVSFMEKFPLIYAVGNNKINATPMNINVFFCPFYNETVHLGLFSRYTHSPEGSVFRTMDVHYHFFKENLINYGYEMSSVVTSNALETMENFQLSNIDLADNNVLTLQRDIRSRFIESDRNNPQDNLDESPVIINREEGPNFSTEPTTQIEESIQYLPAASVGVLTTLSVGQALVVFSYFFGIDVFQSMIHQNSAIQDAFVYLYTSNNMEIPPLLSDAINSSPRSIASQHNFDLNTPTSYTSTGTEFTYIKYVAYGLVALGILSGGIYLWKNGMLDANTVSTGAKTFKETLQEKYTNFK